ncbi:hypothetical protein LCGC14_1990230 [marine sediment metagenome]|uniref:Uncharacterized protein n=1 Tax=marine sediment metagenome TaxID=412755 RepID=A0A0F9I3C9_9ZZZZ
MSRTIKNLDTIICDLAGDPLRGTDGPIAVRSVISNSIARGHSDEPARAMKVALSIYEAKKTVTLEDSDFKLAKGAVEADQVLNNMAKAAAFAALEAAEVGADA